MEKQELINAQQNFDREVLKLRNLIIEHLKQCDKLEFYPLCPIPYDNIGEITKIYTDGKFNLIACLRLNDKNKTIEQIDLELNPNLFMTIIQRIVVKMKADEKDAQVKQYLTSFKSTEDIFTEIFNRLDRLEKRI